MKKRVGLPMDREAMFHEQNALLEEQHSKIMEEFDRVMQLSSTAPLGVVESPDIKEPRPDEAKARPENTNYTRMRPDQLLETLTQINAKCRSLQEEVSELMSQLHKKLELQDSLDQECEHLERERNASQVVVKNTRLKLDKLERQVDEQERKLQDKEMQNSSLKKQRSELEREIQRLAPTPRSDPAHIQRLAQEKETLKSLLHEAKQRRPVLQKQLLWEKEERRNRVLHLEKQIAHLLKVFQKQTQLIENLKKQKGYYGASHSHSFGDADKMVEASSMNAPQNTHEAEASTKLPQNNHMSTVSSSGPAKNCHLTEYSSNALQNNKKPEDITELAQHNQESEASSSLENNWYLTDYSSNASQNNYVNKDSTELSQYNQECEANSNISVNYPLSEDSSSTVLQNNHMAEDTMELLQYNQVSEASSSSPVQNCHLVEDSSINASQNTHVAEDSTDLSQTNHVTETSSSNLSQNDMAEIGYSNSNLS